MGIHDRDYYGNEPPSGLTPSWNQRSAVENVIIINVVVFVLNLLFSDRSNLITQTLSLHSEDATEPWMWWRTLTYGFAHANMNHIFWNMFGLWMLGRTVEQCYGKSEFLRIYLSSVVACGAVWLVRYYLFGMQGTVLGASGAVCCIEMLFVLNFPKVILMVMGIIPMPAWVLGIILVVSNMYTQPSPDGQAIAYDVHLTGIAFAAAYFFMKLDFRSLPNPMAWFRKTRRKLSGPQLKVHDPIATANDDQEADRILQKIHEQGQDSLTSKERKFMEKYSRRVRDRRQQIE